ncbi:helix-turn-helix domain-containing protein [Pasteurella skyensis]|uniref:Helix-turn-helix domain-containing protein n=1 Tax=Phocoenobacter skyensis TaxID=97481 RepID=A0AAJ6N9W2_9PAST|nr:helix-turn-helix domain-containing protein [Pasteurella skyensis]MDP8162936.1 helix-turn-helix domain-containing protein [Pasteurella skyensis]MDP8172912.1 helix-turn-helix domain-containing protein [Pasteurella skyensis]MDP8176642.1 helix-turn-helix domain-containing protein [Pasteurella skyensis]MDP8179412.1 helix-turn-helix domain-containing protein [Pasteurella skyensis]MDP8183546.1 helix-turn-helix domain-containing protein [Pasteurella skyensis]
MSLKRKELEVLKLIYAGKTIDEILFKIDICERNLRYIIDNLNFYLDKILSKRIEKERKILRVDLTEKELNKFYKEVYKKYYILESEERAEFILMSFLFIKSMNLKLLEEKLNVTRSTLKKDIEVLNQNLSGYDLKLSSKRNKYTIFGNEKKLRHLKAIKFLEYINLSMSPLNKDYFFQNIDKELLNILRKIVLQIEKRFLLNFKDDFIKLMEIFLYVSVERIQQGYIIDRKANYNFLVNTVYYEVVKDHLKEYLDKNLTYEIAHLTEYFISGGIAENIEELKEKIEEYLQGLLVASEKEFNVSFSDGELYKKLVHYLTPAIYRLRNNFTIKEQGEKDEIFVFVEKYSKNENNLPENLTENEIFHIAKEIKIHIQNEKNRVISLKVILSIIEKNTKKLDRKKLVEDLLAEYGDIIKKDETDIH